jgi:hypothetical protein
MSIGNKNTKPSIVGIVLNEEELTLLKRQTDRLYLHKTRSSPREVRRREEEFNLLKAVMNRLATLQGEGPYELNLRRKDLRVLEGICLTSIKLLMDSIILGYAAREKKEQDPILKQKYAQYRSRAEKSLDVFTKLNNKIQGLL